MSGPAAALGGSPVEQEWRGQRLGLPRNGPGSLASRGRRLVALLADLIIAGLIAGLFTHASLADQSAMLRQNDWGVLVWFVMTVVAVSFFGFTPGLGMLGLRVARLDGARQVGPLRAIPRTVLVGLIIPAVIWDADLRGLHDKATGTAVVSFR